MLDFTHILNVLINDIKVVSTDTFLSGGLFIWMTHIVTRMAQSDGAKVFWLAFSVILLRDILQSNTILLNSMTYVAIAIIFTHFKFLVSPLKMVLEKINRRSYNKYKRCVDENSFLKDQKHNEKLQEENKRINENKSKRQAAFLNKLSKKLDSF